MNRPDQENWDTLINFASGLHKPGDAYIKVELFMKKGNLKGWRDVERHCGNQAPLKNGVIDDES